MENLWEMARPSDPGTSWRAAKRAQQWSTKRTLVALCIMADGRARIDEEIDDMARQFGAGLTDNSMRAGRLVCERLGLVRHNGVKRDTSRKNHSREWVITPEGLRAYAIIGDNAHEWNDRKWWKRAERVLGEYVCDEHLKGNSDE
jgi:hypothetical protein